MNAIVTTASQASTFDSYGVDNEFGRAGPILQASVVRARGRRYGPGGLFAQAFDNAPRGRHLFIQGLEDGSRQIHSFQYPGDFCDLHRYILPDRDETTVVQALSDCSVATIDYANIDRLLGQHPKLGLALWRATLLVASVLRERMLHARRGSALQRVANLLCEQLARREAIGITSSVLPITQVDVADAAALSIVHVNRTIQTLRSPNVLSKARQAIEVVDRQEFAGIAEFDGSYLNMPKLAPKSAVQTEKPCGLDRRKRNVI